MSLPRHLFTFGRGNREYRVIAIEDNEAENGEGLFVLKKYVRLVVEKRDFDHLGREAWIDIDLAGENARTYQLKDVVDALISTALREREAQKPPGPPDPPFIPGRKVG